ncbi:hypothetical protein Adt_29419 [Abeliophyllum distichum]|uniref:Uncharacterized protein n=1 Tax=Abeliophyllum distichum TaxID=126358 RepID=A0ABD1R8F2_9LAMI
MTRYWTSDQQRYLEKMSATKAFLTMVIHSHEVIINMMYMAKKMNVEAASIYKIKDEVEATFKAFEERDLAKEKAHDKEVVEQWKVSLAFEATQQEIYRVSLDKVVSFVEEKRPELDIDFLLFSRL